MLSMAATTTQKSSSKARKILDKLQADNPGIAFVAGARFSWDPTTTSIHYHFRDKNLEQDIWSLLHELGHALSLHRDFTSDMNLLHIEVDAWEKAIELGQKYDIDISEEYVQDCLDSYRDWLHTRATCPTCFERCLQVDIRTYRCHNCLTKWHVTKSRLCRAYRRQKKNHL